LPHTQRLTRSLPLDPRWEHVAANSPRPLGKIDFAVAAAQAQYTLAEDQLKKAIMTFLYCCLPWEEADTRQYWGWALLAAAERARHRKVRRRNRNLLARTEPRRGLSNNVRADEKRTQGANRPMPNMSSGYRFGSGFCYLSRCEFLTNAGLADGSG